MKRVDAAQIEHEAEKAKKKAEKMEPVVFKEPKFAAPKYSRKEEKPKEDIKEAGIIIEQRSLEEIEAEKKRIQMEKHCQVSQLFLNRSILEYFRKCMKINATLHP